MAHQANKDIETICDNYTVRGLNVAARKIYSEIILSMAAGNRRLQSPLTTHFVGGKRMLKLRFSNILCAAKKRGVIIFLPLAFAIICAMFVGFDFSPAQASEPEFAFAYFSLENPPPFREMSNIELAVFTLQRNHGHCGEEFAELRSRFTVAVYDTTLDRLAPIGLARRLIEIENLKELSNPQLADIILQNYFVDDLRIREEIILRLAYYDDTEITHFSTRELALRLREWGNLSALLSISPGVRELLMMRLSRHEPNDMEEHRQLDTLELARRLNMYEGWRWVQ
jgi:hypothetical protein